MIPENSLMTEAWLLPNTERDILPIPGLCFSVSCRPVCRAPTGYWRISLPSTAKRNFDGTGKTGWQKKNRFIFFPDRSGPGDPHFYEARATRQSHRAGAWSAGIGAVEGGGKQ